MKRSEERSFDQLRKVVFIPKFNSYAEGSCLVKFGNTHVICNATVEERVPPFLRNSGSGWVTAEYSMLPRSTHSRMQRESAKGKLSGRTMEIQRLIGRSLRAAVDLKKLGERQVIIDCDVIAADGGTRTASITGGYIALSLALHKLVKDGLISSLPLINQVAAVSCGIVKGSPVLDLDYNEDSTAEVDSNFVMNSENKIIEVQGTAEDGTFSRDEFNSMLDLAEKGMVELFAKQNEVIEKHK